MAYPKFIEKVFKSYATPPLLKSSVGGVPLGVPVPFCGDSSSLPEGYLLCDGSAISRTSYADLFSVIGTAYGAGDGSSTFNLPDGEGKTFQGGATRGYKTAGLPNISGGVSFMGDPTTPRWLTVGVTYGAFSKGTSAATMTNKGTETSSGTDADNYARFSAQDSNAIYGSSTTVQPPAIVGSWIVRYQ